MSVYNVRFNYVSPEQLRMPAEIVEELNGKGVEQREYGLDEIENVLEKTDVLYMTRIQKERFNDMEEYEDIIRNNKYRLTPEMLNRAKDDIIVMHPLPRVDEISEEVDNDPRAAYFRQMENGMYLRMALLDHMLN